MRLLFLPYDLVHYLAGFLRVRPVAFLAATALGSLPGTVAFVLLGTSLSRLDRGMGAIDRRVLGLSVGLMALSALGARLLRRRPVPAPG